MPGSREEFQYALWRVVPDIERGEALNVGVVLFCRRRGFLAARSAVDAARLQALGCAVDVAALEHHLELLGRIAAGDSQAGPIAALSQSERFGWLTAPSSTLVQPSPVHTGLSAEPADELERLFGRLVVSR